jgi:hypothetical protein
MPSALSIGAGGRLRNPSPTRGTTARLRIFDSNYLEPIPCGAAAGGCERISPQRGLTPGR